MDYLQAISISLTGMELNRTKVDVIAINLANANAINPPGQTLYKPMTVMANQTHNPTFESVLGQVMSLSDLRGVENIEVVEKHTPPRMVHDPSHPLADSDGYIYYPNINTVQEMTDLVSATRAYEANVRALNSAKRMALKALEIGE